ncbi:MAG: hypothetical protein WCK07_21685, partial [Betaproteobacteria bacterium]
MTTLRRLAPGCKVNLGAAVDAYNQPRAMLWGDEHVLWVDNGLLRGLRGACLQPCQRMVVVRQFGCLAGVLA